MSNSPSGTRKVEPIAARRAFGPKGSAQPSDNSHTRAESIGAAQKGAHVARIRHAPEGECHIDRAGHLLPAEDADDARRMSERRNVGEQCRLDVLAGHEHLDRLEAGVTRGVDEILALGDEEPELVPPAALVQLPDELELLVLA